MGPYTGTIAASSQLVKNQWWNNLLSKVRMVKEQQQSGQQQLQDVAGLAMIDKALMKP